jgi:hypothetical protein
LRQVQKTSPVLHAKALTSADQPGTFEAIFAVFGNEDRDGDILELGAFTDTLANALPPVVWSHDWLTPPVGVTLEAAELDRQALERLAGTGIPDGVTGGAYAKARLLVDVENGEDVPLARHVHAALKAAGGDGRMALREFSWGGRVLSETVEHREDQPSVWRLNTVELAEWGPCLKGANPATELLAAKALTDAGVLTQDQIRHALGLHDTKAERRDSDAKDPPRGGDTGHRLLIAAGCPLTDPPQT